MAIRTLILIFSPCSLSASVFVADHLRPAAKKAGVTIEDGQRFGLHNLRHSLSNWMMKRRKSNRKLFRASCVRQKFRRRSICTRRKTAMKRSQRKGNISPRWEWLRSWCSEVGEVWVGLRVEWVEIFGATPGNLLKRMVGLGGLEPPTSPLSVVNKRSTTECDGFLSC